MSNTKLDMDLFRISHAKSNIEHGTVKLEKEAERLAKEKHQLLEACKSALKAINERLEVYGGATGAFLSEIDAVLKLEVAITKAEGKGEKNTSPKLTKFSLLALGTRFKYGESNTVWVKIGADLVAKWDVTQIDTGWLGQSICSATGEGEEIEVIIVEGGS